MIEVSRRKVWEAAGSKTITVPANWARESTVEAGTDVDVIAVKNALMIIAPKPMKMTDLEEAIMDLGMLAKKTMKERGRLLPEN